MWSLSTALLFIIPASFSMAEVGQPLLHRSNDTGPARFFWKMAYSDTRNPVLIHSPSDKEVFFFNGNKSYKASSHYENRVANISVTDDAVSFSLKAVTQADAGNYFCREHDHAGPFIHDCGQYLYYLDENTVPVLPDLCKAVTRDEGQTVNLTCVVKFSLLPVPGNGYSWTFSASDSDAETLLRETGVTLTRSSLRQHNTGSYSCAVREDPNYTGKTSGKSSIYLTVMASPGSPPVSPPPSATPPVGLQSDFISCPDACKTPFIIVMVLLGVAVLAFPAIALSVFICYKLKYIEIKVSWRGAQPAAGGAANVVPGAGKGAQPAGDGAADDVPGAGGDDQPGGDRIKMRVLDQGKGAQPAGDGAADDVPGAGQIRRQDPGEKASEDERELMIIKDNPQEGEKDQPED